MERSQAGRKRARIFQRFLAVVSLSMAGFSPVQVAHAADWIRTESAHFVVYSNVGESITREYLKQLEAFKYLVELMLGADQKSAVATAKFTLYLLDDQALLRTVRPTFDKYLGGVYMRCVEGSQAFAYRPLRFDMGRAADYGLQTVLHEYAHHVMFSRIRMFFPKWYVEGFADYLSTVSLQRGTFAVGGANQGRVAQLLSDRRWIDSEIMLDPAKLAAAAKERKVNGFQFYAQAWILTHYMLADSARTQAFNRHFERLGRGDDAIESFEEETKILIADLQGELRAHLRRLPGIRVSVPDLPQTAVTVSRIPKARQAYLLDAAVLRTCPSEEQGQQLIEKLRRLRDKHGDDTRLRVELSRAELLFGDASTARAELEALADRDEERFEISYLLGRVYYEAAQNETGEAEAFLLDKAQNHFLAAYQLDKRHPPTLHFLSRSLDVEEVPSRSAMNAATAAAVLAPSVPQYAFNAAAINQRGGDKEAAIRVLRPFASDPHNPSSAMQAAALIKALEDGEDVTDFAPVIDEQEETEDDESSATRRRRAHFQAEREARYSQR